MLVLWVHKCGHNGLRGRTQRYKCNDCGRRFDGGVRRSKAQVITDYIGGKQTLEQLADKYQVSKQDDCERLGRYAVRPEDIQGGPQ